MADRLCKQITEIQEVIKMSLLSETMENCIILDKHTRSDGRGGTKTEYVDGAPFTANISLDTSTQARIGEQAGVKNFYTVLTPRNVSLQFHDVFRRLSDGKIFRVTSDGDDKKTPQSASLNLRLVSAEEFTLTDTSNGNNAI